jgi:hypothetical protein
VRHTEADLRTAARHVAEGEARVERQLALIDRMSTKGHDTAGAESVLATMQVTLMHFRDHLEQIEADLTRTAARSDRACRGNRLRDPISAVGRGSGLAGAAAGNG